MKAAETQAGGIAAGVQHCCNPHRLEADMSSAKLSTGLWELDLLLFL
jgi:hypothetical protein